MVRFWATDSAAWDHTARQLHMLNMLTALVASFGGGTVSQLSLGDFHPYVDGEQSSPKGRITHENFHVLRAIADQYVGGK